MWICRDVRVITGAWRRGLPVSAWLSITHACADAREWAQTEAQNEDEGTARLIAALFPK